VPTERVLAGFRSKGGLTRAEEYKSVAAGVGEVDRADKGHRHQQNDGSEQSVNDQDILLKFGKWRCKPEAKRTPFIFNELARREWAGKSPKRDSCGQ
jgi:Tfp pilus assembly protein PilP